MHLIPGDGTFFIFYDDSVVSQIPQIFAVHKIYNFVWECYLLQNPQHCETHYWCNLFWKWTKFIVTYLHVKLNSLRTVGISVIYLEYGNGCWKISELWPLISFGNLYEWNIFVQNCPNGKSLKSMRTSFQM